MRVLARDPNPDVLAEFAKRARAAWDVLDAHLAGRKFAAADRITTADISLCGYLFFDDELGVDWKATHPNIAAWLERIRSQPRWRHPYELMPGHPRPD
jgi:glutathione S-transferase